MLISKSRRDDVNVTINRKRNYAFLMAIFVCICVFFACANEHCSLEVGKEIIAPAGFLVAIILGIIMAIVSSYSYARHPGDKRYSGKIIYRITEVSSLASKLEVTVFVIGLCAVIGFALCGVFLDDVLPNFGFILQIIFVSAVIAFILSLVIGFGLRIGERSATDADMMTTAPTMTAEEREKLDNITLPAIRDLGFTSHTSVQSQLCNAMVVSKKVKRDGRVVVRILIKLERIKNLRQIIVYEGIAPEVNDTLLINVNSWIVRSKNSSRRHYEFELLDIDSLREVDFDWNKLQENFQYGEGVNL